MHNIGLYLKVMRSDIGMTQREMAKKLRATPQTVSKWEANQVPIPLTKFLTFCEVAGVDPVKTIEALVKGPSYYVGKET